MKSMKSAPTFISFSAVTTSSSYTNYETVSESNPGAQPSSQPYISPVYEGDDPILATASKKLYKKDATTRLKALNDILSVFQNDTTSAVVTGEVPDGAADFFMVNKMRAFLPHFVYAYPRLSLDNNRRVREQLNAILSRIIRTDKKLLQLYMKSLIGYWWLLTADTIEEVRVQAIACFEEAIPRKKRAAVLHFLAPSLLDCLRGILEDSAPKNASDEEEVEKYERVTVSVNSCARTLMASLEGGQNASLLGSYEAVLSEKSCLASLQSPSPAIKQSVLALIQAATSPGTAPIACSLLSPAPNVRKLRPVVSQLLDSLVDSSAVVVAAALDCLLGVLASPPAAAAFWSSGGGASVQKHLVPKLRALLKAHPLKLLHYLVPIVGALPADRASIFGCSVSEGGGGGGSQEQDVDALCGLVKALDELAETQDDCIGAAVDVAIVEVSLLLLLRSRRPEEQAAAKDVHMGRVGTLLQYIVEHVALVIHTLSLSQSSSSSSSHSSSDSSSDSFDEVVQSMLAMCSDQGVGNLTSPAFALCRSLNQLNRATAAQVNLSAQQWMNLLWLPLSEQLGRLPSAAYSLPPSDSSHQDAEIHAALESSCRARSVLGLSLAIFGPKAKAGGCSSGGYAAIVRSLEDTARDCLSSLSVNAHLLLSPDLTFSSAEDAVDLMKIVHATEVLTFLVATASRGRHPPFDGGDGSASLEALFGCQWISLLRGLAAHSPRSGSGGAYPSEAAVRRLLCSLLAAVGDSGSSLAPATVRRHVGQLLQYGMQHELAAAMNIVLFHFIGQGRAEFISSVIRGEEGVLRFLRARCSRLVSEASWSGSSLEDDIHMLLAVAELSLEEDEGGGGGGTGTGGDRVLHRAIENWNTPNKLCVWLVLNILYKNLSAGSAPPQWLQLHTALVADKLVALFFGRVRSGQQPAPSRRRPPLPAALVDWAGVEQSLLPILPLSVKQPVLDAIARVLNGPCVNLPPPSGREDMPATTTQMQPKKWSRHVLDCAELIAVHQVQLSLVPMTRRFWTELLDGLLDACDALSVQGAVSAAHSELRSRAAFVLRGVVELVLAGTDTDTGAAGGGRARSLVDPAVVVDTWTCALLLASLGPDPAGAAPAAGDAGQLKSNLLAAYVGAVRAFSAADRAAFLSCLLDTVADYCRRADIRSGFIIRKGAYTRLFCEVLQAELLGLVSVWLDDFYPAAASSSSSERARLHSPRGQDLSAGATVYYIQKHPVPESDEGEDDSRVALVAVEAKVLKVHVEAGQDAYYSIRMLTGTGEAHREIQTEWHKLSLLAAKDLPADQVVYVDSSSSSSSSSSSLERSAAACERYLQRGGGGGFGFVPGWRWLLQRLTTISKRVSVDLSALSDGTAYWQLRQEVGVFCLAFRHLCTALPIQPSEAEKSFLSMIVPRLRGLVQHLTGLHGPQSLRAWEIGLNLLQSAVATRVGVGSGAWLPAILTNLISSAAWARSPEAAESLREEVVGQLLRSLSALLSCTVWQAASEVACEVVAMALSSRGSPALTVALVTALRHVWQQRALLQQQQGGRKGQVDPSTAPSKKQRWEAEAFDLVLAVFVDGPASHRAISRAAQRSARMEARLALHYCLVPLSRQAAIELLMPSANLQPLIPRLQRIMDSATGCDLDGSAMEEGAWASVRLTACKVLDVYSVSQDDSLPPRSQQQESPPGADTSSSADWSAEEAADLERDRAAFLQIMGVDQLTFLMARFSEETVSQLVLQAEGKEPAAREEGEGDAEGEEEDEDDRSALPSKSPAGSFKSQSSSQKVGLKRKLQAMRDSDVLGSIFAWMLCMQRVDNVSMQDWTMRARCGSFLLRSGMMQNAMHLLLDTGRDLLKVKDLAHLLRQAAFMDCDRSGGGKEAGEVVSVEQLSAYALFRTVCTLPAMARNFWISDSCSRSQKLKLSRFVEERARSALISREMALISSANKSGRWDSKELQVKGNLVSGEVTATYMRDETSVEMKITLPSMYPLRNVEVSCTSRIGMADGRWRRWVLQIIQLLSMQDGSVVDAVLMWKCNIEKEFDGVEPCPICYCILHAKSLSLPTLGCPTCRNKFHPNCLFTWFRSSGKSKCVICQQEFFY